ncbi:hypothetical protein [Marinobacter shengliensis]
MITVSVQALRALYPKDNGVCLDLTEDEDLSNCFDQLRTVREQAEVLNAREAKLKQRIQGQMGEATTAVFRNGWVSWKRSKDSVSLNTRALLEDQPDLLTQYSLTKAGSRRFLIH